MALTKSATAPSLRSSAWSLDCNRNRQALPITTSYAAPITTQVPAAINAPAAAVSVAPAASAAGTAESLAVFIRPAGRSRAVTPVRGGRARQVSRQVLSPIMEDQGQVEAPGSGSGFRSGVGQVEYARPEQYSFPPAHRGRGLSDFDDPFVDACPASVPGTGFSLQRAPSMSGFRG